jgi:hypothetical protein
MDIAGRDEDRVRRSATLIASTARWGSPSRQRASADRHALGLAGDPLTARSRRATPPGTGLDDIDLEPDELTGDLELRPQ